jgi:lysine biosynthesis protein LysW
MATGYCPDCDEPINVGNRPKIGQRVTCPECGFVSEIVDTDPVELDWPDEFEGEDEDYAYDEA